MLRISPGVERKIFYGAAIAVIVFLAFLPCLKAGFLTWDDDKVILGNYLVRTFTPSTVVGNFTTPVLNLFNPLTQFSFQIEYALFGPNPFVFHLNNLLLHIAATLLFFLFAQRCGLSLNAAGVAALLFGLHPMRVESVAWITERKDVLYRFFYLLALLKYQDYIKQPQRKTYLWCLSFGFLSVLAKSMALSLPWILLLYDWFARRKWTARVFVEKLPFLLLIESVAAVTYSLQARVPDLRFPEAIYLWIWSAFFYIRKFFLPLHFSPLYQLPQPVNLANPEYLLALIFLAGLAAAMFFWRKDRLFIFSVLFYFGSIFFLFQFDTNGGPNPVADRFMTLPSLGFCLWLGFLLAKLLPPENRSRAANTVGFCLAGLLAALLFFKTYTQCFLWQNSENFWGIMQKEAPDNPLVHNNRGEILSRQGDKEAALAEFSEAIRLDPTNPEAQYNKGLFLLYLGKTDEALTFFDKAILLDPRFAEAYNNKGFIYGRIKGLPEEAMANLDKAISLDPYLPEPYANRGIVYSQFLQEYDRAIADLSRAIELNPAYSDAYFNRGIIFLDVKHQLALGIADFSRAIELHHPESYEAYNRRGYAYARQQRSALALLDFNQSIALKDNYFAPYFNRGSYYFEQGDYPKALENYEQAVRLEPNFVFAHFLLAQTNFLMKNYVPALSGYQRVIQMTPNFGEAYYRLSLVYEILGEKKKAEENALKAKTLGFVIPNPAGEDKRIQQP